VCCSRDNLDALQATRRALVAKYAPLAAKFKGGAIAGSDAARKRHRALVAKRILVELDQKGEKAPSEAALERMANADIEHIAFCDKLEADFARFILLENDIADVSEQIRNREECLGVGAPSWGCPDEAVPLRPNARLLHGAPVVRVARWLGHGEPIAPDARGIDRGLHAHPCLRGDARNTLSARSRPTS
jgi:hypothetical protein